MFLQNNLIRPGKCTKTCIHGRCDLECLSFKLSNQFKKNTKMSEISHTDTSEGQQFLSVFCASSEHMHNMTDIR